MSELSCAGLLDSAALYMMSSLTKAMSEGRQITWPAVKQASTTRGM